jgi:hypothetical protein
MAMRLQENGGTPFDPSGKDPLARAGRFWRSVHGFWMARGGGFSSDWLYSSDGRRFQETQPQGLAAQGDHEEGGFLDGADDEHRFVLDGSRLTVDGELFVPVSVRPPGAVFVPLPEKRELAYLFIRPDGGLLAVTEDVHRSYETFHLFVGQWTGADPVLTQVPVRDVTRYRDGGTTVVKTDLGTLYVPTPWKPKATPTWTRASGEVVDLEQADPVPFSESGLSLTLHFPTAVPQAT